MTPAQHAVSDIPMLGSGLGFRQEIRDQIIENSAEIDFVEIIAEMYAERPWLWDDLAEICEHFPIIPHGVRLSIGSDLPLDMDFMKKIRAVSEITKAPFFSEHLCMTRAPGIDIGHLSPILFSQALLDTVIDKVNRIQDYLGKPLALENVTYVFDIPNPPMPETEFFNRMVEATDCGVLLDVTNIFINSVNHEFDGVQFMRDMPLDNVVQLHLAGGFWSRHEGEMIDGHCEPVQNGTWELLEAFAKMPSNVKGCILEHDSNYPDEGLGHLLETIAKAREIMGWPSRQQLTAGVA